MTDDLIKFWHSNSAAILISLITGFIFFVLGPIGVWFSGRKIRRERTRKASDTLIDLIEEMLVSGEIVEPGKITTLFRAIERENGIVLDGHYDADNLLDDITLRFAKSKHLDAAQKDKYTEEVVALRAKIGQAAEARPERRIPITYAKSLEQLRTDIQSGNTEKAVESVTDLEKRLSEQPDGDPIMNIFRLYSRMYRRHPTVFLVSSLLLAGVYIVIVRTLIFHSR